jgi:LAGLIDADG endonuclease
MIAEEWSYIAGFFDGEGHVGIVETYDDSYKTIVNLTITQKRPEVLYWIRGKLGYGTVRLDTTCFKLYITKNREKEEFLKGVQPYLHVKNAEVEAALMELQIKRNNMQKRSDKEYQKFYGGIREVS